MNLSKIKSEILKLKRVAQRSSSTCNCTYVEIAEGEIPSMEVQLIIESNRKCRLNQNTDHVGFTMIIINHIKCASHKNLQSVN